MNVYMCLGCYFYHGYDYGGADIPHQPITGVPSAVDCQKKCQV